MFLYLAMIFYFIFWWIHPEINTKCCACFYAPYKRFLVAHFTLQTASRFIRGTNVVLLFTLTCLERPGRNAPEEKPKSQGTEVAPDEGSLLSCSPRQGRRGSLSGWELAELSQGLIPPESLPRRAGGQWVVLFDLCGLVSLWINFSLLLIVFG